MNGIRSANELVGSAKGLAEVATAKTAQGFILAPKVEYGASIAQPWMVEKDAMRFNRERRAARGPGMVYPHDAVLHTPRHPVHMKI
jgi:hypothetical protein